MSKSKRIAKNKTAVAEVAVEAQAPAVEVIEAAVAEVIEAPVAEVQEMVAAEAVTSEAVEAPVKKAKNKPNETTRTIEHFADDTKGIRPGTRVSFKESNKPDAKTIAGEVKRIFDFWAKPERQEAKIKGDNGNRYYRFESGLTVIPAGAPAEAPAEAPAAEVEVAPEA